MIERVETGSRRLLEFRLSGKLTDGDYKAFVPAIDAAVWAVGTVRLVIRFEDFDGWELRALWGDIRFVAGRHSTIDRVALVGDRAWDRWMALVGTPFTSATVRYFEPAYLDAARSWVGAGL
jgi:hypothetical protein